VVTERVVVSGGLWSVGGEAREKKGDCGSAADQIAASYKGKRAPNRRHNCWEQTDAVHQAIQWGSGAFEGKRR